MKTFLITIGIILLCAACEPEWTEPYETFTLPKGKHSSGYPVELLQSSELEFHAIFDESAIYKTTIPENQWDTNKLLGFADCNDVHHTNSARFGWRWLDDKLEILAYCYVAGERIITEMGTVNLGEPGRYRISITKENYLFQLNERPVVTVPRKSKCEIGAYYMLFPYFGGDEVAPHDIRIKIKRTF